MVGGLLGYLATLYWYSSVQYSTLSVGAANRDACAGAGACTDIIRGGKLEYFFMGIWAIITFE